MRVHKSKNVKYLTKITCPLITAVNPCLRWNHSIEAALMVPFTTVVTGNHALFTFRQTAGDPQTGTQTGKCSVCNISELTYALTSEVRPGQ